MKTWTQKENLDTKEIFDKKKNFENFGIYGNFNTKNTYKSHLLDFLVLF